MYHFYFRADATNYYAFDSNGNVITTPVKTAVKYAPKGWEQMTLKWERHAVFLGVFRSLTPQFDFVEDSRAIMRHVYYTQGVEGAIFLDIERQNNQTSIWEPFYTGRVDLSTFQDYDFFTSVNVVEVGLKAYLDNNSKIIYNIYLDQPSTPNVQHILIDGIWLNESIKWYPVYDFVTLTGGGWLMPPSTPVQRDSEVPVGTNKAEERGVFQYIGPPDGTHKLQAEFTTNFFYQALIPQTIDFYISSQFHVQSQSPTPYASVQVYLVVVDVNGVITQNILLYTGTINDSRPYTIPFTANPKGINLNKGDKLYLAYGASAANYPLYVQVDANPDVNTSTFYYTVTVYGKFSTTGLRCMKYMDVMQELVHRMTTGRYTGDNTPSYSAYSDFMTNPNILTLDTYPAFEVITSGSALKNFQSLLGETPQIIKTSFDDMYQDLSSTFCLGAMIDKDSSGYDRLRVEPLELLFNKNWWIADLGVVSNLVVKPAMDYLYNNGEFGQGSYSYDSNNYYGRWEYFGAYKWIFPYLVIDKKLNKVSPYRSDVMGIEMARFGVIDSPDDTFVIDCDPTLRGPNGEFKNYRPPSFTLDSITANPAIPNSQTWYNFGRSPVRSLYRNGAFLRSVLDKKDSNYIVTVGTSALNYTARYTNNTTGAVYIEYSPIQVSTLSDHQLFKPMVFQFDAVPPVNIAQLMAQNPLGYFGFMWNGVYYKGFPISVGANLSKYNSFNFVLLCHPDISINATEL